MSKNNPIISVIIPCRNGGSYILEQINCLSLQRNAPPFEVIISDNGSTDGSVKKALELYNHKVDIKSIDSSSYPGISHARNQGVVNARGKYVLFCDADDFVEPDWISEMYAGFIENNADLVAGKLIHHKVNQLKILCAYNIPFRQEVPTDRFTQYSNLSSFSSFKPSVPGCNFGVRKSLYLEIGGMDLSYIGGSEETDFTWRALDTGAKLVSANRAIVNYRLRETPKGIFKQQYNYQRTKVILWINFRDSGMPGPSLKYSSLTILRTFPMILNPKKYLRAFNIIGGNLGAIHGIIQYKILHIAPERKLKTSMIDNV